MLVSIAAKKCFRKLYFFLGFKYIKAQENYPAESRNRNIQMKIWPNGDSLSVMCISCKKIMLKSVCLIKCITSLRFFCSPRPLQFIDIIFISLIINRQNQPNDNFRQDIVLKLFVPVCTCVRECAWNCTLLHLFTESPTCLCLWVLLFVGCMGASTVHEVCGCVRVGAEQTGQTSTERHLPKQFA